MLVGLSFCIGVVGVVMTINDLRGIIMEHGSHPENINYGMWYFMGGCELLEHISDIPGFVSLLRKFKRRDMVSLRMVGFVDEFPDPINAILGGGVAFVSYSESHNAIHVVGIDEEFYYRSDC